MKTMVGKSSRSISSLTVWVFGSVLLIGGVIVGTLLMQTPVGQPAAGFLTWLFATDTTQTTWYITRAAGLTSYLLLWFSVVWGLAVSSKILDRLLHRSFTYDFHQYISLLALGFVALHLGSLLFDRYLPYSLAQLLVPGLSAYRPFWVAVGIIAFYLTLLVTVTFYMRSWIGMKTFRAIHVFSLLAYVAVTIHGIFSGTDSSLVSVFAMYIGTFLSTVFLTAYWYLTKKDVKNDDASGKGEVGKPAPVKVIAR